MRVDPEAVYLELSEGTTVFNFDTGETRVAPAVVLHWKDGRRWRRRSFVAAEGQTLGALLDAFGLMLDSRDSLQAFLDELIGAPADA